LTNIAGLEVVVLPLPLCCISLTAEAVAVDTDVDRPPDMVVEEIDSV
jgi:hypothetical protein